VKVTTEDRPQREVQLHIELEPADVEPYLERAHRQASQRLKIPGFRKGKVPRHVFEQMMGHDYLLQEALDLMIPDITSQAVQEASVEMAGVPSVTIEGLDPVTISAIVPLVPKVDLGDYKAVRVAKDRPRVTGKQVDEFLERLQTDLAAWEPVEGPVAYEDLLNISVQGWADGEEFVKNEHVDFVPRENSRVPVPGFVEEIVGLKQDKEAEFTIQVPEDYQTSELAGKACKFKVTVHEIKRKVPSPLDDEFAKGVGEGFETLDALKERVRQDLLSDQERGITERYQDETLQAVLEKATLELSPLLVNHEAEHMFEDHQEATKSGRMTVEQYQRQIQWSGKSDEEVQEELRTEAETRIKRAVVLREIATEAKIEASDEDVDQEIETMAAGAGQEADQVRKMFEAAENQDSLRRSILNRKAIEHLTEIAGQKSEPKTKTAPAKGTAVKAEAKKPTKTPTKKAKPKS
jgi:trigger factor